MLSILIKSVLWNFKEDIKHIRLILNFKIIFDIFFEGLQGKAFVQICKKKLGDQDYYMSRLKPRGGI